MDAKGLSPWTLCHQWLCVVCFLSYVTLARQDLKMQIIVTQRGSNIRGLQAAAANGVSDALDAKGGTASSSRSRSRVSLSFRSRLLRAGLSMDASVSVIDKQPNPDEILDLFCEQIFNQNVSVITSINYNEETMAVNTYILELARFLGYPVISWDPLYTGALESDENSRVLQIAPTVYHECQAVLLLLERYNWTQFSVVQTKKSGMDFTDCLDQLILKTRIVQGYTKKERFTKLADIVLDYDPSTLYFEEPERKYTQHMLQELHKKKSRVMILHARLALDIVDVAESMGLMSAEHMWILTSLSIPDMANSGTTFPLGMLALYPSSEDEKIYEAIKTAIKVWAVGMENAIENGSHRRLELNPTFSCDNGSDFTQWRDGKFIHRYMRDVELAGPPLVSFSHNGVIENAEVNILNTRPFEEVRRGRVLQRRRWETIGKAVPRVVDNKKTMTIETEEIVWPGESATPPLGRPEQRFFRIATKEEHPYIVYVPPGADGTCGLRTVPCTVRDVHLVGNASQNSTIDFCCSGLCVELLEIIAEKMNFRFHMYEVPDGQWGVINPETHEWNGLIRELLDGKADMVLSAFIINNLRAKVVDFTIPFLDSGITIMVSIRKGAISPYAFLEPYDFYSWILILIFSVHATGASIFIFEWLSPSGLDKGRAPAVDHKFSLFRSFWLIWAMLFGAAVSIDVPRGVSSRFLSSVWALFALVFLASYTANLAAFMITLDKYYDLSGIEDWRLLNPTKLTPHFKFATIPDSSTEHNLKVNYPTMHRYMTRYNQTTVESATKALKDQAIQAFIYDANVLEYTAGRDEKCELLTVGKWYAMSGYGIGLKRGSKIQDELNGVILDLQHMGEVERLQDFWQAGACHAKKEKKDKSSHDIGILNFISAFILLAAGVVLGLILLALEHLYFKSGRKCLRKYDKCGCCALVSLSMGKSLTFEQSVFEAIDIQRKHRCKDPICEMHLWKARHQLDMALLKIKQMQCDIDDAIDAKKEEIEEPSNSSGAAAAIETVAIEC